MTKGGEDRKDRETGKEMMSPERDTMLVLGSPECEWLSCIGVSQAC